MSTDANGGDARPAPDPDAELDLALDPEAGGVAPEFGGSADEGVVSSVGEHDPMAGDAAGVLGAELGKLYDLFGDLVALLDNGELDQVGQRLYGVVRETLEFEAALQRVVVPEVADAAGRLPDGAQPAALVQRLQAYDELNSDRSPDVVRGLAVETVEDLRAQERVLLPAVQGLAVDVRDRLGEDLRQVMG
jgi:hypothetical protein